MLQAMQSEGLVSFGVLAALYEVLPRRGGAGDQQDAGRVTTLPCHEVDPELFFAEEPAVLEVAKSVCTGCARREACLSGALARREQAGVWGGEIVERGRVIAVKRGRGRPRTRGLAAIPASARHNR